MRVALQISGEYRCLHLTVKSFMENIVQSLQEKGYDEIFVFSHTWDRQETSMGTFPFDGRGLWHLTMPVYSNEVGQKLYKPISFMTEKLEDLAFLKGRSRILCMYYSIYMANEIRKKFEEENSISFDLVIRYRTDLVLEDPLLKDMPTGEPSFLVIPKSTIVQTCDGPFEDGDLSHICDYIAYGTPDKMNVYCSTFLTWLPQQETPIGESCLAIHLRMNGLRATRKPIAFYLVEGNGTKRGMVRRSDFVETSTSPPTA